MSSPKLPPNIKIPLKKYRLCAYVCKECCIGYDREDQYRRHRQDRHETFAMCRYKCGVTFPLCRPSNLKRHEETCKKGDSRQKEQNKENRYKNRARASPYFKPNRQQNDNTTLKPTNNITTMTKKQPVEKVQPQCTFITPMSTTQQQQQSTETTTTKQATPTTAQPILQLPVHQPIIVPDNILSLPDFGILLEEDAETSYDWGLTAYSTSVDSIKPFDGPITTTQSTPAANTQKNDTDEDTPLFSNESRLEITNLLNDINEFEKQQTEKERELQNKQDEQQPDNQLQTDIRDQQDIQQSVEISEQQDKQQEDNQQSLDKQIQHYDKHQQDDQQPKDKEHQTQQQTTQTSDYRLIKMMDIPLKGHLNDDIMRDPRTYLKGAPSAYLNTPNAKLIKNHRKNALQLGVDKANINYAYKGSTVIKKESVLLESGDQYMLETFITPKPLEYFLRPKSTQTKEPICQHCLKNPFASVAEELDYLIKQVIR